MPDDKKYVPEKPAAKEAAPVLGPAGESTDPAVQDLLAQRAILALNDDQESIKLIDAKLADLGVN